MQALPFMYCLLRANYLSLRVEETAGFHDKLVLRVTGRARSIQQCAVCGERAE